MNDSSQLLRDDSYSTTGLIFREYQQQQRRSTISPLFSRAFWEGEGGRFFLFERRRRRVRWRWLWWWMAFLWWFFLQILSTFFSLNPKHIPSLSLSFFFVRWTSLLYMRRAFSSLVASSSSRRLCSRLDDDDQEPTWVNPKWKNENFEEH